MRLLDFFKIMKYYELTFSLGHAKVNQRDQNLWQTGEHRVLSCLKEVKTLTPISEMRIPSQKTTTATLTELLGTKQR